MGELILASLRIAQMLEQQRAKGVPEQQRTLWAKLDREGMGEGGDEEGARGRTGAISYGKARSRAKLEGKQGKTPWGKQ